MLTLVKKHGKDAVMACVLLFGGWMLLPPAAELPKDPEAAAAASRRRQNAKYVIRMTPNFYMPGTVPLGVGEPLQGLEIVARRFEELHPDTRIEFVSAPTTMREWLVTQLSSGMAPDILQVNVEDIWQDVHKGWYLPLDQWLESPNPYAEPGQPGSEKWWDLFAYQAISRGKAGPDGKQYCISYDMVETGVFYNKGLFAEHGLRVPQDWEEFLSNIRTLRERQVIPFLCEAGLYGDWGLDLIFDQLYYPLLPGIDLLQDPIREQYLEGYLDAEEFAYLNRKGFFTNDDPRWAELFLLLREWQQTAGPGSLTSDPNLFVNQRAAMMWGSSATVQLFMSGDLDFDWDVFYFPAMTEETSPYARGVEMCVIGGSAMQYSVTNSACNDTGDPQTSEKLERVVGFLQFMTTPENAEAVINEAPIFLPNIVGVEPRKALAPFAKILERRYTTTKLTYTFDLRFNDMVMRMLRLYLNNGIDDAGFLDWMSESVAAASATYTRRVGIPESKLEARWKALAPLREPFADLPPEAAP